MAIVVSINMQNGLIRISAPRLREFCLGGPTSISESSFQHPTYIGHINESCDTDYSHIKDLIMD